MKKRLKHFVAYFAVWVTVSIAVNLWVALPPSLVLVLGVVTHYKGMDFADWVAS